MPSSSIFTVDRSIELFSIAIRKRLDAINMLSYSAEYELYSIKATLYSCLIDTMAKCAYPDLTNRVRFVKFLEHFCNWEDCNRISMPQLKFFLDERSDPELLEIKREVEKKIATWSHGHCIEIENDPYPSEFPQWPVIFIKGTKKRITLDSFDHKHMMWYQRNSLVHESSKSGLSIYLFQTTKPHYVGFGGIIDSPKEKDRRYSFQLYIPLKHYEDIISSGRTKLIKLLFAEKRNPFELFDNQYLWLNIE